MKKPISLFSLLLPVFLLLLGLFSLTSCAKDNGAVTEQTGGESAVPDVTSVSSVTESTAPVRETTKKEKPMPEGDTPTAIHVSQLGYAGDAVKRAIVTEGGHEFYICRADDGITVFEGRVEAGRSSVDTASGDRVNYADFTALTEPGTYYVYCGGVFSYPFSISDGVYTEAKDLILKSFYYQRCGAELEEQYAGDYAHPACHTASSTLESDQNGAEYTVLGGWHDAGDYGRYVNTGAIAAGKLLYAYVMFPDAFGDDTGIPESGNGIPDILDEAAYEVRWMLQMQDPADGGVYDILKSENYAGYVMPERDTMTLLLYPKSCSATATATACYALCARLYADFDQAFAESCAAAAKLSYEWVLASTNDSITEGSGYVNTMYDEKAWAAIEMYETFGDDYRDKAERYLGLCSGFDGFMYNNVGGMAALCVATNTGNRELEREVKNAVINSILGSAAAAYDRFCNNVYEIPHGESYQVLSNSDFGNDAVRMLICDYMKYKDRYRVAIAEALNYVTGKNALSQCYLTGVGTQTSAQLHHRPSMADGIDAPVPGLVAGGAVALSIMGAKHNGRAYDYLPTDTPDMRSYVDSWEFPSYNEPTIYTDASFVMVAAYLESGCR